MFNRRIITALLCFSLALMSACQKTQPPAAEAPAETKPAQTASAPASQQPTEAPPVSPPASATELQEVLKRTYQTAVMIDASRSDAFVVGDFNGDNSQDIAIVVKPSKGMLSQLNSEYANWILEDPHQVALFYMQQSEQSSSKPPAPVLVRQGDNLLAVIHGHQDAGWRNPKATQTYLLKNAVGDKMEMQRARTLLDEAAGKERLPPLRGDVIRETLGGTPGFIYWTGAKYAWHPPKEPK